MHHTTTLHASIVKRKTNEKLEDDVSAMAEELKENNQKQSTKKIGEMLTKLMVVGLQIIKELHGLRSQL